MPKEGIGSIAGAVSMADVLVGVILLICVYTCYRKGLVKAVFDLFGVFAALALANGLYPEVCRVVRENWGLLDLLKTAVAQRLGFSGVLGEQTVKAQATFINGLPVPKFLSELLLQGNNDELYRIFNVTAVEDYVASYIANMLLNAAVLVVVFAVVFAALRFVSRGLGIVNKIPVIGTLNRLGGAVCGFAQGTLIIWVLFAAAALLFVRPPFSEWLDAVESSRVARLFYENNMIMDMIVKIN